MRHANAPPTTAASSFTRSKPSGCPYAAAICSSIFAWLSVMMGMSAPGMNTTKPTPAFCAAVALTASSAMGLRTNGNASAMARRFSRHASMTHCPMRTASARRASSSSGHGSPVSPARAGSAAGSAGGAGGATTSPSGMGSPASAAICAARLGSVVTTIAGTPASRISRATRPHDASKPATTTARSASGTGATAIVGKYEMLTRAFGAVDENDARTNACTSCGALSSM